MPKFQMSVAPLSGDHPPHDGVQDPQAQPQEETSHVEGCHRDSPDSGATTVSPQDPPQPIAKPKAGTKRRGYPYGHWQVKQNVIDSARGFEGVPAWRKVFPGAFACAFANEWINEAAQHMRQNRSWTQETLIADASRHNSPGAWKAASASAYATARKRKLLETCCAHMDRQRVPNGYWTKESCIASAQQFQTILEWTQKEAGAVDAAFANGWYKEAVAEMVEVVSFGEFCIRRYLMCRDIEFTCEKTYDDLVVKRNLRYDFFLPRWNLLIEYHGEQHFVESKGNFGRYRLAETQVRDAIKKKYALDHGIPLLEISSPAVGDIEALRASSKTRSRVHRP